jgi:hypothetical protein
MRAVRRSMRDVARAGSANPGLDYLRPLFRPSA